MRKYVADNDTGGRIGAGVIHRYRPCNGFSSHHCRRPGYDDFRRDCGGHCRVGRPVLLAGLASGVVADTVALFVSVLPAVPGWTPTRRTIVALAPAPNSPRWHIRTALPLHLPCDGEADTKVSPAGNGSRTTTPWASDGPALLTVKV